MLYMDLTSNYLPQGCMAWGDRAIEDAVFLSFWISPCFQARGHLSCAYHRARLPADLIGFSITSLEFEADHTHYASIAATLDNLIHACEP
jgi:hypothetical protein